MNPLCWVYPPLAALHAMDSTRNAVEAVLGPPSQEEALAAENVVLREGIAEWQRYAAWLEAQNAELRAALPRPPAAQ